MKNRLILLLLFCSNLLVANISVYFIRGKSWSINSKTGSYTSLNTGDIVPSGSRIKLSRNSEVILMNGKKQFALLRDTTVIYTYTELEKLLENCRPGSLFDNLAKEIASGLKHKPDEEDLRRLYLETKGGVVRAECHSNRVHFPGNNCIVSDAEVFFSWPSVSNAYRFQIEAYPFIDPRSSILVDKRLSDTLYVPNQVELELLKRVRTIDWKVSVDSMEACFYYRLTILPEDSVKQIRASVSLHLLSVQNPLDKLLIQTSMYEEAGLLSDANRAYKELIALGDNNIYFELYKLFKWRNGIY